MKDAPSSIELAKGASNNLLIVTESNLTKYLHFEDPSKDVNTNTEIFNVTIDCILSTK